MNYYYTLWVVDIHNFTHWQKVTGTNATCEKEAMESFTGMGYIQPLNEGQHYILTFR